MRTPKNIVGWVSGFIAQPNMHLGSEIHCSQQNAPMVRNDSKTEEKTAKTWRDKQEF
jgi:hypothetical protein